MSRREQNAAAQLAGKLNQTPGPGTGPRFSVGHGYVQEESVKLKLAYNDLFRIPPTTLEQMRERAELLVLSRHMHPEYNMFVQVIGVEEALGRRRGDEDGWGWVMDQEGRSVISAREHTNRWWDIAVTVFGRRSGSPDVDVSGFNISEEE